MSLSTVLVLHPDPSIADRVRLALEGVAEQVLYSAGHAELLERGAGADVALVVVAASLRGANGYAVAADIKERWPAAGVVLTTSGFEVFDQSRAKQAGVAGHLRQPFAPEAFRALVESLVGPLEPIAEPPPAAPPIPEDDDPLGQPLTLIPSALEPVPSIHPPAAVAAVSPPVSDERLATFLPRDYRQVPLVQVDPDVVGPAVERAILEVLPEVVEAILRTALGSSTAFRDLVAASVDESVRDALPDIATRVVRERLAQLEARADTPA
jgi:CheY-like chemotaxis protein